MSPDRGQALVEFTLVFPIFMMLLVGFIEFVFVFNGVLAVDLASRGAALAATEGGSDGRERRRGPEVGRGRPWRTRGPDPRPAGRDLRRDGDRRSPWA